MPEPMNGHSTTPIFSEFASDPDMVGLIQQFVGELPARAEAILGAWRDGKFEETHRVAHQLKGASAGYGFGVIGLAASRVEAGLRGRSLAQIEADTERIGSEIRFLADLCRRATAATP